jgi:uncharacterized protein YdaU (DUF1376 family)
MHYYAHNIADYRKDTLGLSLIEHGAYRQLLDQYYLDEVPLSLDEEVLYRLVNARNQDEKYAVRYAIKNFFTQTEAGYVHGRCESTIAAYKKTIENNSKAGKISALKAKQRKENSTVVEQPNNQPITNNHKPITNNQKKTQIHTPSGVDINIWEDYLKLRRAKKLPMTETALKGIEKEATKAKKTLNEALTICVENNWVGFKAEWLEKFKQDETPQKWPGI